MVMMNLNYNRRVQKRNLMRLNEEVVKQRTLAANIRKGKEFCKSIGLSFHFLNKKINANREDFNKYLNRQTLNISKIVQDRQTQAKPFSTDSFALSSKIFHGSPKKASKHSNSSLLPKEDKASLMEQSLDGLNTSLFIVNRRSLANHSFRRKKLSNMSGNNLRRPTANLNCFRKSFAHKADKNFRISNVRKSRARSSYKRFMSMKANKKSLGVIFSDKKLTIDLSKNRGDYAKTRVPANNRRYTKVSSTDKNKSLKSQLKFSILGINSRLLEKVFCKIR